MRNVLWAVLAAVLLVGGANAVLVLTDVLPALSNGAFVHQTDADSYTRLLRVQAMWQGASPRSTQLDAMAAPEGLDVHWGHVVEYLLLAAGGLMAPVLGFERGLFWAGLFFAPVMEILALLALCRGLRGIVPWWGIGFGMLALVLARNVTINSGVGRADHHALEACLAVAVQAWLLRAALLEEVRRRETLLAGLACGLAVWATPEGLIIFLPAVCAIVLSDRGGARLVTFAGAALAVMAVGLAVERPVADWLAVEPDRLSALQVAIVAMPLAVGAVARRGFWRTGGLLAVGSAVLIAAFPMLLQGGYANIDPVSRQAILAAVEGEASLMPNSPENAYSFFYDVWASALVLAWCAVVAVRSRGTAPATALLPYLVVGILLTMHAARVTLFLQSFAAVPWALMVVAAARHREWAWVPAAALFASGPAVAEGIIAPTWFPTATSSHRPLCEYSDIAPTLRALTPEPGAGTIVTDLFHGPEVAYKTGWKTLSGPYHRAAASILDLQTIMVAPDPRSSEATARHRQVGLVLLCRREGPYMRRFFMENPAALVTRLYRSAPPPWLEPVALPPALARTYVLYRARPALKD
ncbi:hypothetical protein [Azospirillum sp. sgz301742]